MQVSFVFLVFQSSYFPCPQINVYMLLTKKFFFCGQYSVNKRKKNSSNIDNLLIKSLHAMTLGASSQILIFNDE